MRPRLGLIGLLLAAIALIGGASAAGAQCPVPSNLPALVINVSVAKPTITYHHDVDLFGLPKLEHHSERPPPGSVLLGLTKISDHIRSSFRTASLAMGDGRICVWLAGIDAQLGDPVMNVFVAQEYAPDTCEYRVILDHENTHVRFNLETLRDWMPSIRASLTEAAKHKFPAIFQTPPTDDQLRHYLFDNMKSVFDLMSEDMRNRNATIDTPENYRREHAKCHDWSRHDFKLD